MNRQYTDKDIENIVKQLVDHLYDMPDGTAIDTWHLLKRAGYDMDSFSEGGLMDIHESLFDAAKSRHIILDMSAHENSLEGLPFLLDYLVWNQDDVSNLPYCGDRSKIRILKFLTGGYFQGRTEVIVARETEGAYLKMIQYPYAPGSMSEGWISLDEWDWILNALYLNILVHKWEKNYCNPHVMDGEQWEFIIGLASGRKIEYSGSNDYPLHWDEMKTLFLEELAGFLHRNSEKEEEGNTDMAFPEYDRPVSKDDMENYISYFEDDEYLNAATEPMLAKARSYIDLLCQEENVMALHMKGYACYGGNRLYPCDWKASRDCMLLLYDKTDNPLYANTLGYIYYYGRCNGGLPEYDKAFHYFGISAANGLYEGMYKLADMFAHGYGCRKSPGTARSLYEIVYTDSLRHYLQGEENAFADAALRMGNVYAKGIGTEADVYTAYEYYLQAEYAAGIRARKSEFFGNVTVVTNIQKSLELVRSQLPEDYFTGYLDYIEPYLFAGLAGDRHRCRLSRVINPAGHTELIAERLPCRQELYPDHILLTIPQVHFCDLTKRVSLTVDDKAEIWFKDDAREVKYDFCEWSCAYSRYEFYYDEELVAWIRSEFYRFYRSPEEEPYGPEHRLVSVRFDANGRTYDYICEDPEVKAGDRVVVNGYGGETEVTVTDVRVKRESELPLPVERYKKIVRKIRD